MEKEINGVTYLEYSELVQEEYKRLHDMLADPVKQEQLKFLINHVYKEAFRDGQSFSDWLAGLEVLAW